MYTALEYAYSLIQILIPVAILYELWLTLRHSLGRRISFRSIILMIMFFSAAALCLLGQGWTQLLVIVAGSAALSMAVLVARVVHHIRYMKMARNRSWLPSLLRSRHYFAEDGDRVWHSIYKLASVIEQSSDLPVDRSWLLHSLLLMVIELSDTKEKRKGFPLLHGPKSTA